MKHTQDNAGRPFDASHGSAQTGQATPEDELIRQLLDSRIAKTEREWVGGREIKRLRGIIARNARTRLSGDDGPLFVTPRDIKESLEILYAEMEREDSPNAKVTDESPK